MKKLCILLLVFSAVITTNGQKIKFQTSFEKAKQLSIQENKPIAIFIIANPPQTALPENIRMLRAEPLKVLDDEEVANKFNSSFINYKIDYQFNNADTNTQKLIAKYNINRFPAFVFIDSQGGLLLKDFGASTSSEKHLLLAYKAIEASKQKSITEYDAEYQSGKYDKAFLKVYIQKRQSLDNYANAAIVEKYVDFLTVADLNDYNEVLFILKAGPLLDSKAYKLAWLNRNIIDSIYKNEAINDRLKMNDAIIINSFNDAVANKSVTKANFVANFVRGSWGNNYKEATKQSALKMIQYYYAVKDTSNYLRQASYYYDQYYMNISVDSIKKMESENLEKIKQSLLASLPKGSIIDTAYRQNGRFVWQSTITASSRSNDFATELNNAAYNFYLTKTKNTTYLTKAVLWSKRSIEIAETAAYYDTLAHLVYALGFYSEAESTQTKALELAIMEKQDTKLFEEELAKIKNRTL